MISELDLTKVMRLSRFSLIYMFISLFPCLAVQKGLFALVCRDDNETGFFGYPLRPAPNGTGFKFNLILKLILYVNGAGWDGVILEPVPGLKKKSHIRPKPVY